MEKPKGKKKVLIAYTVKPTSLAIRSLQEIADSAHLLDGLMTVHVDDKGRLCVGGNPDAQDTVRRLLTRHCYEIISEEKI